MCPSNQFSDDLGFDTCKSCPANSTAPAGSTKMSECKCKFGDLHEGICACDPHHALQKGDCVLCTKLHLQCETPGSLASTAVPDKDYTRLEPSADEAHRSPTGCIRSVSWQPPVRPGLQWNSLLKLCTRVLGHKRQV